VYCIAAYSTVVQQRVYRNDEAVYERALEVAPQNVLVMDNLGNVYLNRGDFERALDEYRKAYSLAPQDPNPTFFLARGLFRTRQYVAAEPLFERLSNMEGQRHERLCIVLLSLAISQAHEGKLSEAEATLGKLSNLDADYPGLHRALGVVFQTEGKLLDAQLEYVREYQLSKDLASRRQALYLTQVLQANHSGDSNSQRVRPNTVSPKDSLRQPTLMFPEPGDNAR
jgi:Flp pilus assembly protein TadD